MAGFAHADHHDTPLAGKGEFAGFDEIAVDSLEKGVNGVAFQSDGALRGLDQIAGLAHVLSAVAEEKARIIPVKLESLTFDRRQ
ncbi:hypothetical protein QS468_28960 [Bacillus subtilis]|nr:3-dehydroquinate synthase class II [Pseudomonas otitidis]MDL5596778.1 hypothetical protein [Bacillus subtilis]